VTKTTLVTGATGLIGAEVTANLVAAGDTVVALIHNRSSIFRNNGRRISTTEFKGAAAPGHVLTLSGDVTHPQLGLTNDACHALSALVDRVVHCAATTDFGRSQEVYDALNVDGTKHVIEFLQALRRSVPLVHTSTAYVCGERVGDVYEHELDVGQTFGTPYEESKFRAEKLVRDAAAQGLRTVIVRPSIVVGAARTGAVREFKNIYPLLKLFTEGRVKSIPGLYDARLDLAPVDHVANVITTAALRHDEAVGQTLHAVGAAPHTLRDFSDVLAEYPSFHAPRYVPPATFSIHALTTSERTYYERVVRYYDSFFVRRMTFRAENATAFAGPAPPIQAKPFLRKLLNHCLRVGYLGAPLPAIDEVLETLANATA
jgi:thioester reductase-like protein